MKIVALKTEPIARILAMIYAVLGFVTWIAFAFSGTSYITLPFGIIGPMVHLNLNLNLRRSTDLPYNLLLLIGSIVSFAVTGWLTAAAGVFCFNLVATKGRNPG
ncbi:MAG: hypothetical protein DMG61_05895 [Acidobacteria bacterium]|nr:MAG: hypothetical protein DMG61_05895 [Acidobacteriota bacterium]